MDFVMGLCDRVTVLDYGTVVAAGPPEIISEIRGCSTPTSARRRKTMTSASQSTPRALVVDGLVAGYGGGDVLHDVSLTVAEGGITCVVGPNGAGKSTLLATISGLLRPRRGTISSAASRWPARARGRSWSLGLVHVPQNHSLFRDMTVRENIELGGYMLADRRWSRAGARDVEEMFPAGGGLGGTEGGQPVRRPAAAGRVRPLPDARPGAGHPGRAVDGPVPEGAQVGVRRGPHDERRGQDDPAGRAERPRGPAAVHPRRGAGERPGPAGGHRPRGARAPGDRRAVPRRRRAAGGR